MIQASTSPPVHRFRHSPTALACALVALVGLAGVAHAAPIARTDYLTAIEDVPLTLPVETLLDNDHRDAGPFDVAVSVPARKGTVVCDATNCAYQPPPGWAGVDTFHYQLTQAGTSSSTLVQVLVSPAVMPIAADWNHDGVTDLGWLHAAGGTFRLLTLATLGGGLEVASSACAQPPLPADFHAWPPVAGDWNGDGHGDLGVFDPTTRTFHLYVQTGGAWTAYATFAHPEPGVGGAPLAGDWDDDGIDEVGLFLAGSSRFILLATNTAGSAEAARLTFSDLPSATWWPVAADWTDGAFAGDQVGVWGSGRRALHYRTNHHGGLTQVLADYSGTPPRRRPITGRWQHPESIGFFDPDHFNPSPSPGFYGGFFLYLCDFDTDCSPFGGQRPILLPPPEDPFAAPTCGSP